MCSSDLTKSPLSMSREQFDELYRKTEGFIGEVNRNHPSYDKGESFLSFLEKGGLALLRDHADIVQNLI